MKHSNLLKSELAWSLSLPKGRKKDYSPLHAALFACEEGAWREYFGIYPSTGSGTENNLRRSFRSLSLPKGRKKDYSPLHAALFAREEVAWREYFAVYPSTGSGTKNASCGKCFSFYPSTSSGTN